MESIAIQCVTTNPIHAWMPDWLKADPSVAVSRPAPDHPGESPAVAETIDPESSQPFPWRSALALWPDEWRERWGLRANVLLDAGLTWPEDERQAFAEVSKEKRNSTTGT